MSEPIRYNGSGDILGYPALINGRLALKYIDRKGKVHGNKTLAEITQEVIAGLSQEELAQFYSQE